MINKSQVEQNSLKILDSSQILHNDKDQIIAKLKQLLPNVVNSDNQLNTQALQDVLDIANTTSNNQGYELTFAGKGIAKAKADEPTTKELKAELEQSKDFDNTENVVIRGDNIDTLKILRANYTNKIKMIYIDPPYNTKNENFVYNDNFKKNEEELIKEFGLAEETQNFLTNVYGTRSHSGWLSFMYPRLKIARELLKEDGVIFISIDDNEQANLKIICDEIFGEENFISEFIWKRRISSAMSEDNLSCDHEYLVCYQKQNDFKFKGVLKDYKQYKNPNNDVRGDWILDNLTVGMKASQRPNQYYDLINPKNGMIFKCNPNRVWAYIKTSMIKLINEDRIYFPEDDSKRPMLKRFKSELKSKTNPFSSLLISNVGLNTEATKYLQSLLGENLFDYAKPISLIKTLSEQVLEESDIILDFFAGSGTTGDAVMQLNTEDGGKRKYILAQLDEPIDEKKEAYKFCKDNGFKPVISSITIERLNRAGEKIKADIQAEFDAENSKSRPNQEKLAELQEKLNNITKLDIGYKVFSLKDKPCIAEVTNDGGQVSFVPKNLREKTLDTLTNMLCATCKPLHTKIETLITDKLYKADNEIYLLGSVDKSELEKYKDLKINVDGYSDLDLENFLNLGVTDKDNVSVVY
ncbi:DNA methylase family protein [Francisella philomiragia]|uniref:site-specific DNA-methyltransferase n=1 Tax=Francisella philomiragia TaxID=28110 RepID=UPI0005A57923|nr:site-specific DNA-methyltransferase [Francisella philomiragia]AJI56302.1 DNA methylase family protein [Francisella philomiragia]